MSNYYMYIALFQFTYAGRDSEGYDYYYNQTKEGTSLYLFYYDDGFWDDGDWVSIHVCLFIDK